MGGGRGGGKGGGRGGGIGRLDCRPLYSLDYSLHCCRLVVVRILQVLPSKCCEYIARCMVWPIVNDQPGWTVYAVEQPAADQSLDQLVGVLWPLKGRSDLLIVMPSDFARWCVLRCEPPQKPCQPYGVRPRNAQDH